MLNARQVAATVAGLLISGCTSHAAGGPMLPGGVAAGLHGGAQMAYVITQGTALYSRPTVVGFDISGHGNIVPASSFTNSGSVFGRRLAVDAFHRIYVLMPLYGDGVSLFSSSARGVATPIATVNFGGLSPAITTAIALDSAGHIWITRSISQESSVVEYPPIPSTATGTVTLTPLRVIAGNKTKLHDPAAISVGPRGLIYVGNGYQPILAFKPTEQGNIAPLKMLWGAKVGLYRPRSLAFDGAGRLYAIDGENYGSSIAIFAAGAGGNVAPLVRLPAANPNSGDGGFVDVAFDAAGEVVALWQNTKYGKTVSAIQIFKSNITTKSKPMRIIGGSKTTLVTTSDLVLTH